MESNSMSVKTQIKIIRIDALKKIKIMKNKNEIKVVEEILEHFFFCTCRLIM